MSKLEKLLWASVAILAGVILWLMYRRFIAKLPVTNASVTNAVAKASDTIARGGRA